MDSGKNPYSASRRNVPQKGVNLIPEVVRSRLSGLRCREHGSRRSKRLGCRACDFTNDRRYRFSSFGSICYVIRNLTGRRVLSFNGHGNRRGKLINLLHARGEPANRVNCVIG